MVRLLIFGVAAMIPAVGAGRELVYQGSWNTTNRKLDGVMTCVVSPVAKQELKGRFYGTWQGASFDYTVHLKGPTNDLRGTARIDGAAYECRAWISREAFKATFSGDRYTGSFDLRRIEKAALLGKVTTNQDR